MSIAFHEKDDEYEEYSRRVQKIRDSEFQHVKAGAALYSSLQVQNTMGELLSNVFGNPHSSGPSSLKTCVRISFIRSRILSYFNVNSEKYDLIFTSGSTGSLKLIGECFPWSSKSTFICTRDSHTSVLGLRAYAAKSHVVSSEVMQQAMTSEKKNLKKNLNKKQYSLFAFPAECNFSGRRHDLNWINHLQNYDWSPDDGPDEDANEESNVGPEAHHVPVTDNETKDGDDEVDITWCTLLDAAKFIGSSKLDLSQYPADFTVLSFYKIFGYPTGIGALLIRKERGTILQKSYFGGGTMLRTSLQQDAIVEPRKELRHWMEDGTLPFLDILALDHGFDFIDRIKMETIAHHTANMAHFMYIRLQSLKYENGQSVVKIYGEYENLKTSSPRKGYDTWVAKQGPILTCNFMHSDGSFIGYAEVEKLATLSHFQLRAGCFCNPGACQDALQLTDDDLHEQRKEGHVCWDNIDLVNGKPTGAVRLSFGVITTSTEIEQFVSFVQEQLMWTVPEEPKLPYNSKISLNSEIVLDQIFIYPIKSCKGMSVPSWPIGSSGLLYDREWAVVDALGQVLRLKHEPRLFHVETHLDLVAHTLTLSISLDPSIPKCILSLEKSKNVKLSTLSLCNTECILPTSLEVEGSSWLSAYLGYSCRLVRTSKSSEMGYERNFANEGHYLLLSTASLQDLQNRMQGMTLQIEAFRANIIIRGCLPYAEDTWKELKIQDHVFTISGPCSRCSMINVDTKTGYCTRRVLKTLAKYRRQRSSIPLGQFLTLTTTNKSSLLTVGSVVRIQTAPATTAP